MFREIDRGATSSLTEVECFRTLERARLRGALSDVHVARARATLLELLGKMEIVALSPAVLRRAAEPMPTLLTTLDALHLASALLWRDSLGESPALATHDLALALAARAHGLLVVGA